MVEIAKPLTNHIDDILSCEGVTDTHCKSQARFIGINLQREK